jgi:uncharacterized protein (TIGR02246 family)
MSFGIYQVSPKDEQAIRAVLTGYGNAWNRHDMRALAELFSDDAHWINIVGMHWPGKSAVVAAHEAFHRTFFRETDIELADVGIRLIAQEVAAAIVLLKVGPFTPPDGRQRPESKDRLSLILGKRDGKWRIVHGHNTVVDPAAQPFDPVNSGWPHQSGEPAERAREGGGSASEAPRLTPH